jgi:hypothetical protein
MKDVILILLARNEPTVVRDPSIFILASDESQLNEARQLIDGRGPILLSSIMLASIK